MPHPVRHMLSILALPVVMVIVIPWSIARGEEHHMYFLPRGIQIAIGVLLIVAGSILFQWTLRLFDKRGKGTLAPWDATQHLVVHGPYRYVRNPMITAALIMLLGESLAFASHGILAWTGIFFLINLTYFILLEEPGLERRFGESYREYKRNVPRWIPRRKPWNKQD